MKRFIYLTLLECEVFTAEQLEDPSYTPVHDPYEHALHQICVSAHGESDSVKTSVTQSPSAEQIIDNYYYYALRTRPNLGSTIEDKPRGERRIPYSHTLALFIGSLLAKKLVLQGVSDEIQTVLDVPENLLVNSGLHLRALADLAQRKSTDQLLAELRQGAREGGLSDYVAGVQDLRWELFPAGAIADKRRF